MLFPFLFAGIQRLSFLVPHGAAGPGFAFDVALAALLILPPTVLMGGTIPILTQALSRSLEDATRFHAFVYAFNTAGAVVGALAASFVLIPWLGLRNVMFAMAAINLAAGASFLVLSVRGSVAGGQAEVAGRARRTPASPAGLRRRRAARRLRHDGRADRADPSGRPLLRLVAVHLRHGRRRLRALHRHRQLRRLRAPADPAGPCCSSISAS